MSDIKRTTSISNLVKEKTIIGPLQNKTWYDKHQRLNIDQLIQLADDFGTTREEFEALKVAIANAEEEISSV